jgi:hypothetical protein
MSRHFASALLVTMMILARPGEAEIAGPPEILLTTGSFQNPNDNFFRPTGIAPVNATSIAVFDLNVTATVLRAYTEAREPAGAIPRGDISDVSGHGYLDRDPVSGLLYLLRGDGGLFEIDPAASQVRPLFNVGALSIDVSSPFDVNATQVLQNGGGLIVPPFTFGDFAISRATSNQADFLIAGLSVAHPFVLRVRFLNGTLQEARVIVMSSASTADTVNLSRGMAVNPSGTVLTSLPLLTDVGAFDAAFAFPANFQPENFVDPAQVAAALQNCVPSQCALPIALFNGVDMPSRAIDHDAAGDFYVATSLVGSSACGAGGSGAVVFVPSALDAFTCHPVIDQPVNNTTDIAVNDSSSAVYVGLVQPGAIVRFPIQP